LGGRFPSESVAALPRIPQPSRISCKPDFRERTVANALLAVAGLVEDERCNFTNSSWKIDGREVRNRHEFHTVRIINDFVATALSLPYLTEQDVHSLGDGRAVSGAPPRASQCRLLPFALDALE
jgi:glucokinase